MKIIDCTELKGRYFIKRVWKIDYLAADEQLRANDLVRQTYQKYCDDNVSDDLGDHNEVDYLH